MRVYDGKLLKIDLDRVELPGGKRAELEIIRHPGAAAVVPFDGEGHVLLVRQYRHAAGEFILEVPAGTLDPDEAPDTCAVREVEEETGFRPGRIEPLGWIWTTPGFTDEKIWLYAAFELAPSAQKLDADEVLHVERVPFAEAVAMTRDGRICDAKSVCALSLAAALDSTGQSE